MATRYFKRNDSEVCMMSSGNRSKDQPGMPGYPYDWVEIQKEEFIALRKKILRGPVVQREMKSGRTNERKGKPW